MPARPLHFRLALAAVPLAVSVALTGCQQDGDPAATNGGHSTDGQPGDKGANLGTGSGAETSEPLATVTANVKDGATTVPVSTPVTVRVTDGTLDGVRVTERETDKKIAGTYNDDKTTWTARKLLEPGTTYSVAASAVNDAGTATHSTSKFRTQDLSLNEQTYASLQPVQDEVVGVGMPVIVQFDIPVSRKAAFEKHMRVTATPSTTGSWHWISDQEVHWRPRTYWKSGTEVHVDVDINSVNAGNGIYGQMNRKLDFTVGRSIIMKTNIAKHRMRVFVGGTLARTIPITAGKPGYDTRSGTKLIIEKFRVKHMDSATVGIDPGDPEYYNIPDVEYAQRVTYSGEFLHAAPWSVNDQGSTNVSHGCVGMSTENAAWLYGITHRGDPVEVVGTDRGLEDNNGWTDWEQPFAQYKQASALD